VAFEVADDWYGRPFVTSPRVSGGRWAGRVGVAGCPATGRDVDVAWRSVWWQVLDDHGVLASIGSVGDAFDKALAESFVDSFKTEPIADRVWRTRSQLERAVVEYVGWFNHARQHEALGDIPRPSSSSNGTPRRPRIRATDRSRRSRRGPQNALTRLDLSANAPASRKPHSLDGTARRPKPPREDGLQAASPRPPRFFGSRSADASLRLRVCSAFWAGDSPVRVAFSRSRCSRLSRRRSFAACLSAKASSFLSEP
jgi:hypothetical protein